MNILKKLAGFVFDIIETVVLALAIFVVIYLFLFQPHQVKGNSMLPNFNNGEYLLTNKIVYKIHEPQRENIVVFKAPQNEEYDYIKRIIALPGESIKISNGVVYINNQPLDESKYLLPTEKGTSAGQFLKEGEEIVVPNDSYFVLGDNRSHSSDSRDWGFVPFKNIVGLAWFRYWPPSKVGLIPRD